MEVEPYDLPLSSPLSTTRGTVDRRQGFLVRVTNEGEAGVGEAAPLPPFTESHSDCERALERALDRFEDDGLSAAHDAIDPARTPAAAHGLALATLDAGAKAVGVPLYRLLGGDDCRSIPVNATVGDGPAEDTASAAAEAVEDGFRAVKVKVGARDPAADAERLRAVRDAVGPNTDLRADANGAWSTVEARTFVDGVADLDLEYLEQPLGPPDIEAHAELRTGPVPIALDESLCETALATVLEAEAADVVVLKPMSHGSPAATRAAGTTALDAGVDVTVTTTVDAVVARTAAVHVAASLPSVRACGLATAGRLGTDLGPDPAPITEGAITVPQSPGLGVEGVST